MTTEWQLALPTKRSSIGLWSTTTLVRVERQQWHFIAPYPMRRAWSDAHALCGVIR